MRSLANTDRTRPAASSIRIDGSIDRLRVLVLRASPLIGLALTGPILASPFLATALAQPLQGITGTSDTRGSSLPVPRDPLGKASAFQPDDMNPFTNQSIESERLGQAIQTARQRTRLLEQEVAAERLRSELARLRQGAPGGVGADSNRGSQPPPRTRSSGPPSGGLTVPQGLSGAERLRLPGAPSQALWSQQPASVQSASSQGIRTTAPGASSSTLDPDRIGGPAPAATPKEESQPRVVGTSESGGKRYALIDTGRGVAVVAEGSTEGGLRVQRIIDGQVTLNGVISPALKADERWPTAVAASTAVPVAAMTSPGSPSPTALGIERRAER